MLFLFLKLQNLNLSIWNGMCSGIAKMTYSKNYKIKKY